MKLSLFFFKVILTRFIKLSETIINLQVIHFHVYHQHIWLKGCSSVEQALVLSVTDLVIIYFASRRMLIKKASRKTLLTHFQAWYSRAHVTLN